MPKARSVTSPQKSGSVTIPVKLVVTDTSAPWHQSIQQQHAPHAERRAGISTRAINAIWSNIVMHHAKRNIDQSIRKHVRDELPSYTMKNYYSNHSKSLHLLRIVQSAFFPCLMMAKLRSNHAAVN